MLLTVMNSNQEEKEMLPIMHTIRYTEHNFGPMASLEDRIKNVKNVTELKKVKKDITAYMRLMDSMKEKKTTPKNFLVVGFSKVIFLDVFPISNCYEIVIREEGENGDNLE